MVGSAVGGLVVPGGAELVARDSGGTGRWLVVRTWVVEADTAGEARAAAASERGWPLTETVSSLATEPPAAMPVSRPGRPAFSTDFCPQLITFTREEAGEEQVRPCRSPLTVVADGAGVIESVCRAGHRYTTCACQQPDCTGWKAIRVGAHYPGVIP
jgi:hypothetical protein